MVDSARDFAERYAEVESSLDASRIVNELYCDDGVLDAHGTLISGRAELEAFYRDFLAKVESVKIQIGRVAGTGDDVAFEWRSHAVLKMGEVAEAAGLDFVRLREGKAELNVVYVRLSQQP